MHFHPTAWSHLHDFLFAEMESKSMKDFSLHEEKLEYQVQNVKRKANTLIPIQA
jgi:hypothetical protein